MPYIPPDTPPTGYERKSILIPNNSAYLEIFWGALLALLNPRAWSNEGIGAVEAVRYFTTTFLSACGWLLEECDMIGVIVMYMTKNPPPRVLPCDGSIYDRVDYPILYQLLLDTPLIVSADQFRVPDFVGRFPRGTDTTSELNQVGGESSTTLTISQLPPHTHTYGQYTFGIDIESVGVPDPTGVGQPVLQQNSGITGDGDPIDILPPFVAVHFGVIAS